MSAAFDFFTDHMAVAQGFGALHERRLEAVDNFNVFTELVARDNRGRNVRQGDIHKCWHVHLDYCARKRKHAGILAPFGHGKTTQLIVQRVCWELGRDPDLRVKIVCQTQPNANKRLAAVAALLQSPLYHFVFPHIRVASVGSKKKGQQSGAGGVSLWLHRTGFAVDPTVEAMGVLGSGTGGRADLLVLDDVVDRRNAIDEPALRDKVTQNVDEVWLQRVDPEIGRVWLIGTPWHMGDYNHLILDRPDAWCVLRQPISEDTKVIEQEVYGVSEDYWCLDCHTPSHAGASVCTECGSVRIGLDYPLPMAA